jgi:hypothetical protein
MSVPKFGSAPGGGEIHHAPTQKPSQQAEIARNGYSAPPTPQFFLHPYLTELTF